MEVKISLNDESDDIRLELSNSAVDSQVYVTFFKGKYEGSGKFEIEELRLALRKLTAK